MFDDRADAGRQLAKQLGHLRDDDVVVVGLPRGGVPVAAEIARALAAPLDVILVRKLGVPFQPELAMGAIGEDGVRVLDTELVAQMGVTESEVASVERRERAELERRAHHYRAGRDRTPLEGRVVVIVDDGIATGSTAKAACQVARAQRARRVIVAVPVAPVDWIERMAGAADAFVTLTTPHIFAGVGQFYRDFSQTSDEEVIAALDHAERPAQIHTTRRDADVQIRVERERLGGHLTVPEGAKGIVVFVHGSGSSRNSPRNRSVASRLNRAGLATLLFDLLTNREERDRTNVFDIELLTKRLTDVTSAVTGDSELADLPIGFFGASTGAAAALRAAAEPTSPVRAIVSRGGRPDLAESFLEVVRAPTLLIVGGHDPTVLDLNQRARARLHCPNDLRVIPGATHLFEEPGALTAVAELAGDWFTQHLARPVDYSGDERRTSRSN